MAGEQALTVDAVPPPPPGYEGAAVPPPPGSSPIFSAPRPVVAHETSGVHIGASIATRLRMLDADLQILAMRGGGSIVDGVLAIVFGGVGITAGILYNNTASPYWYVYGGGQVVRGIIDLAMMTNPSGAAIQYTHMPMRTSLEVRDRLRFGEERLDAIADMARIQRILDGSINVAVGVAVIPVYLAPNNFNLTSPFDAFVLIMAGVSAITGVITLINTTEAERRQDAYHELRDQLLATQVGAEEEADLEAAARERADRGVEITPTASIGPTGGYAGMTVAF